MKKLTSLIGAFVAATLFTSSPVQADDPPYIDYVYVPDDSGSYEAFYEPGDGIYYNHYNLTVYLDWPQPLVDEIYWQANRLTSPYGVLDSDLVTWPNPTTGGLLMGEDWPGGYTHELELRAIKRQAVTPSNNTHVDNSYYFTYDGDTVYSYLCHGCTQGNGGVYIYNP